MTQVPHTEFYFQRFGFCERQIQKLSPQELGLVVVIPCFNEPDLLGSLESLWRCEQPASSVEVIVVINSAANSRDEIRSRNKKTLDEAAEWAAAHSEPRRTLHLLDFPDLPPKQAGVGLARKIGMDEALRRFDDIGKPEGIIACFDADCRCEHNYLTSIEEHFLANPRSPACSIYFEHPAHNGLDSRIDDAIAEYELHLRYYVQALRYAGFPYAHHAIGSAMAVRAGVYKKQGGMNKRQAGEDFYFLQKLAPLGHFTDLTTTTVIPSPRASDRVPFGTGKAIRDYLESGQIWTYPLEGFLDLKHFFELLPEFFQANALGAEQLLKSTPESIRTFCQRESFEQALWETRENTATEAAFRKRFFHWFNGFQAMKFLHHARDQFYGRKRPAEEAARLLRAREQACPTSGWDVLGLLETYRSLDRHPPSGGGLVKRFG